MNYCLGGGTGGAATPTVKLYDKYARFGINVVGATAGADHRHNRKCC